MQPYEYLLQGIISETKQYRSNFTYISTNINGTATNIEIEFLFSKYIFFKGNIYNSMMMFQCTLVYYIDDTAILLGTTLGEIGRS